MAKLIMCGLTQTPSTIGTAQKWYKNSADVVIVNNTGQTDVRIDKLMVQLSERIDFANYGIVLGLVHQSDENGNSLSASVTDGTTTDATLQALLNQWKDNVFMTDFRFVGTGVVGPMNVVQLEANTRRILKPGQKLLLSIFGQPLGTETTKAVSCYYDILVWYSAAAQ